MIDFLKTKRKLAIAFLGLLGAVFAWPRPGRAQFLGYVSPQTVQSTLAAAGTTCNGGFQSYLVPNLGQTQHTATVTIATAAPGQLIAYFAALDLSSNLTVISDTMEGSVNGSGFGSTALIASGYYPRLYVYINCSSGTTYTLSYSGASATVPVLAGNFLSTAIDKLIWNGASAGSNSPANSTYTPPFATSLGVVSFAYATTGPSGSAVAISCTDINNTIRAWNFSLATAPGVQLFYIPSYPCVNYSLSYTSGGASGATYSVHYLFYPPGYLPTADPCDAPNIPKLSVSLAIGSATTTSLIAASSPVAVPIYVCSINGTLAGTSPTMQFEYGTGATCGTGTGTLTGAMAPSTGTFFEMGAGQAIFTVPAGNNFCVVTGGTTPSLQGVLTYVQQ